jgi:glutamyl/glutaminyl-tRNA synthetase
MFNVKRLDYLNGYYIRQKSAADLTRLCVPFLVAAQMIEPAGEPDTFVIKATGERIKMDFLTKIVQYHQPRLRNLSEIVALSGYFFQERLNYDKSILKWKDESYDDVVKALGVAQTIMASMSNADWDKENLELNILGQAEEFSLSIGRPGKDRGFLLWPLRVSLCGQKMSIGPFEMAEVLGKAKTMARVQEAIASFAPTTESLL